MGNGKLLTCTLFISLLGACANNSISAKTSLSHPRPAGFWENGRAVAQVLHVFDRTIMDPTTREIRIQTATITGSAAVVDTDGLILTNSHVVDTTLYLQDAMLAIVDTFVVCKITREERECEPATVVAIDKEHDLALLKTKLKFAHAVTLVSDSELRPGDEVYSWGDVSLVPLSPLFGRYINRLEPPYAKDIKLWVGDKEVVVKLPLLLMDVRVGHGSSGGPMFDRLGRCVALTSMMSFDSANGSGPTFGITIPSSTAMEFLKNNWPKKK